MEQELEQQLSEFRQQQRGSTSEPEPATVAESAEEVGAAVAAAAMATAPPSQGNWAGAAEETSAPADAIQALKGELAFMEEAFPEAEEGADPASQGQQRRRRHAPRTDRDSLRDREAAPLGTDVLEMKSALEDIENRLAAIQSRQLEKAPMPNYSTAPVAVSAEASRAISEMRAQNEHLRECLRSANGRGPKGLLNIERNLFPGGVRPDAGA